MRIKVFVACLLTGLLLMMSAAGASVAVSLSGAVLFSDDGDVLVEHGVYSRITDMGGTGLFAARNSEGLIGILDSQGNALTEMIYTDAAFRTDRIILCLGGKYGVCSLSLETVVPFVYSYLAFGTEGTYLALTGDVWDDVADAVYIVDEEGSRKLSGTRMYYAGFALNDLSYPCLSGRNGRWGYFAENGTWTIDAMFLSGERMTDGMAAVTLDTGMGVINTKGNWLVSPFCDRVCLNESVIVTLKNGNVDVYTRDSEGCRKVYSMKGNYISAAGEAACVWTDSAFMVYDTAVSKLTVFPRETSADEGWNQTLILTDESGSRLSSNTGAVYASVSRFTENLYCVYEKADDGYYAGLTDGSGAYVLESRYRTIISPAAGYTAAEDDQFIYLFRSEEGSLSLLATTEK